MCYWHPLMPENAEMGTSWVSNIEKNDSSARTRTRTSTKKYSQRTEFYCSTLPTTNKFTREQKKHWHGIESPRLLGRLVTWSTFSFPVFAYVCAVLPLQQVLLISGRFPGVFKKPLITSQNISDFAILSSDSDSRFLGENYYYNFFCQTASPASLRSSQP